MKFTNNRVTPGDIEDFILETHYIVAGDAVPVTSTLQGAISLGLLTICVMVLKNGFTVTGESACADPANFDQAVGQRIAREKAIEKIWPLLGFMLRQQLAERPGRPCRHNPYGEAEYQCSECFGPVPAELDPEDGA